MVRKNEQYIQKRKINSFNNESIVSNESKLQLITLIFVSFKKKKKL